MLLLRQFLENLPAGEVRSSIAPPAPDRSGLALVEGWRGEIACWVQSGPGGRPLQPHIETGWFYYNAKEADKIHDIE